MKKLSPTALKNATIEQKRALYDAIQKKKQIERQKPNVFKPNEAQVPVLKSNKKIRFFSAGNATGKTALGVNAALAAARGYNPWLNEYTKSPNIGTVILDNPMKVREVWLKEMAKWTNMEEIQQIKNGKPYVNELLFQNGSRILFLFHDQDPLVFESIEVDWAIFDEPPPRFVFHGIMRGQRTKNSNPWALIIGTPLAQTWLRTEIYEPWQRGENPDVECFHGSTEQNRANLDDGYIERFSRLLTEEERKIRLEGQFFDMGGLALAHLIKEDTHFINPSVEIAEHLPVIVAVDPHPSKKHVAVALAVDRRTERMYVIGEFAEKSTARQFAGNLLDWSRRWQVIDWVVDSLGSADSTSGEGFKSFIQVLKECGIQARPTTYDEKKDEEWIDRIRTVLEIPENFDNFGEKLPKLRIFNSCYNVIRDVKNVAWVKYRNLNEYKPKLDISNKDYLACVKYALAASSGALVPANKARTVRLTAGNKASIRSRYFKGGG